MTLNEDLANLILELNRFDNMEDLKEAEIALKDNIELDWFSNYSHFLLVVVSARLKRFEKARDYYNQAENHISGFNDNLENETRFRAKFELAYAEKHWDEAITNSESSLKIFKNCNHRWKWARTLIDLGDALVGRNEPGDQERARETYQQSLDMFTEMGAPGYIQVLEERLMAL